MSSGSWREDAETNAERELKEAINNIRFHDEAINMYSQVFSTEKGSGIPCSSSDLLAMRFQHLKNVRNQEELRASQLTQQLFSEGQQTWNN